MFKTIANAFKTPEVRKKLLYTILLIVIFRLGCYIAVPGVDNVALNEAMSSSDGIVGLINIISGGAFSRFSVFAMSITPYITASIVIQLLAMIIPSLERLTKEGGEEGRKKINKYTKMLTIVLAIIEAVGIFLSYRTSGIFIDDTFLTGALVIVGLVAGTAILMWLGDQITNKGIGNGISLILTFNILSSIPDDLYVYYKETIDGHSMNIAVRNGIIFIIGIFILVLIAVYQQHGAIKVPITQSRKDSEGIEYSSHIPIPVNIANVFPVIYAATIMSIPGLIATFMSMSGKNIGETGEKVISVFSNSNWYDPQEPYQLIGLAIYLVLLVTMAFFSSILVFNPAEIADNMIKNGNVIDGIAPGIPTEKYFDRRRKVMAILNVIILSVLVILPDLLFVRFGLLQMSFLGTSLVIVISTLNDTSIRLKGAALSASNNFNLWRDKNGSIE